MYNIRKSVHKFLTRGYCQILPSFLEVWFLCAFIYFTFTVKKFYTVFGIFLTAILFVVCGIILTTTVIFKRYPYVAFINRFKYIHHFFYLRLVRVVSFTICAVLFFNHEVATNYNFSILYDGAMDPFAETIEYTYVVLPAPVNDAIQVACDTLSLMYDASRELNTLSEEYGEEDAPPEVLEDFRGKYTSFIEQQKEKLEIANRNTNLLVIFIILDEALHRLINFLLYRRFKRGSLV